MHHEMMRGKGEEDDDEEELHHEDDDDTGVVGMDKRRLESSVHQVIP